MTTQFTNLGGRQAAGLQTEQNKQYSSFEMSEHQKTWNMPF